jgi:pimeloyl-ACP methyl ester carboxylesterase
MPEQWEPTLLAQREIALTSEAPLELLLLPGLLCDERLWAAQIEALRGIAHVTVARLDGESSISALAQSVLEQAPNTTFMLAGLSMGGYVALEVMRQQPKRVLGLALISTSARPDTAEASRGRTALMGQSVSDFSGVIGELLPKLVHATHLTDKDITATITAMAKDLGPKVFRQQQEAIIGRADSRPHLHEIACPTLIACGREDKITPIDVHTEMAERIPGAHLTVIENCGHLVTLEQPEQISEALRSWLEETRNTYALR